MLKPLDFRAAFYIPLHQPLRSAPPGDGVERTRSYRKNPRTLRRTQKNLVTPSSITTTRSSIPAARASCSSSCSGSSTGSCESRNVP